MSSQIDGGCVLKVGDWVDITWNTDVTVSVE